MKSIPDYLFNKKYLPLLKQMYKIGFNEGMAHNIEKLLYKEGRKE